MTNKQIKSFKKQKYCLVDCPKCNSFTKVISCWKTDFGTRRSHLCKSCEHKFSTYQPFPKILPPSPQYIGKLNPDERLKVIELHKKGMSKFQLSIEFDVSESTIRKIINGDMPINTPRLDNRT
tara:strand:+ start:7355 stop:7723 length:369 start_codon:yes stop_codon:yes gene_type:complete